MKSLELKKDIYWVGALDPELRIFDIIMYTPYGTTYNSYVVKGSEKVAVVETVKVQFFDQYLERLKSLNIDITKIDYIIVDHTEPDHAGSVAKLLELSKNAKVVGSAPAIRFVKKIANVEFESIIVKDGSSLSLGNKTLKFITAPFLHWPDSIYTFVEEDNMLFTCDSFGSHYCNENIYNDLNSNEEQYMEALRYYYDCIMGPFKSYVLQAIDKIKDLKIDMICTGHGPILRDNPWKIVDLYKKWSTTDKKTTENAKITISYVSAYGYTAELSEKISEGIKSVGEFDLVSYDVIHHDMKDILADINDSDGILFGSPTINGDLLEPIRDILTKLNPLVHGGKIAAGFGSYGWSGEAVPNIENRLKELRMKIQPGLKINFKPSEEELQKAFNFGVEFGKSVLVKLGKLSSDELDSVESKKKNELSDKSYDSAAKAKKRWKCLVCEEVFEGVEPPSICPVCGATHEQFAQLSEEKANFRSSRKETFIILGNGAAGYYSASTIRKNNPEAVIKIISAEKELSYYRPQLSDYISKDIPDKKFYISPESWYDENKIELILGKYVSRIEPSSKIVILEDGTKLSYDKLILANGSRNFIPPVKGTDLKGVYTLKYKNDGDILREQIKKAKKAIVIGGGLLGLEAAWELKNCGLDVTVIEFIQRLLPRQLDDIGADLLKSTAESSGIKLMLGESVDEILADDTGTKVKAVRLASGELIGADLILFSVGIRPNKELAESAGVACNRGILVNDKMETSIKDIYACGDLAEYNGIVYGTWTAAMEMGKIAGKNSSGEESHFKQFVSSVIFRALNAEIFSAGSIDFNDSSLEYHVEEDKGRCIYKKLYFKNNKLVGGILIGDLKKVTKLLNGIKQCSSKEIIREITS